MKLLFGDPYNKIHCIVLIILFCVSAVKMNPLQDFIFVVRSNFWFRFGLVLRLLSRKGIKRKAIQRICLSDSFMAFSRAFWTAISFDFNIVILRKCQ